MQRLSFLLTICFLISSCDNVFAQSFRILHYTEASGFDHQTRSVSYQMIQQLGIQYNFLADNDSTGDSFNTPGNLQQYSLIVFSNTSGDAILDSTQRSNFEQFISNGGNVIGIHSASDTYRHSTANGTNTGTWDFYPELLGASVQQNPNHVNGTQGYNIYTTQIHPLINGIPDPWFKAEEYYYWQFGYFDSLNNNILLRVDSTVGPNGIVNSYDSSRAVCWYKITPSGNRVFYTSLGHAASDYTSDTNFIYLIRNAILWAAGVIDDVEEDNSGAPVINCYPNPFSKKIVVQINNSNKAETFNLQLFNTLYERVVYLENLKTDNIEIDFPDLSDGIYFLKVDFKNISIMKKLVRNKLAAEGK